MKPSSNPLPFSNEFSRALRKEEEYEEGELVSEFLFRKFAVRADCLWTLFRYRVGYSLPVSRCHDTYSINCRCSVGGREEGACWTNRCHHLPSESELHHRRYHARDGDGPACIRTHDKGDEHRCLLPEDQADLAPTQEVAVCCSTRRAGSSLRQEEEVFIPADEALQLLSAGAASTGLIGGCNEDLALRLGLV